MDLRFAWAYILPQVDGSFVVQCDARGRNSKLGRLGLSYVSYILETASIVTMAASPKQESSTSADRFVFLALGWLISNLLLLLKTGVSTDL